MIHVGHHAADPFCNEYQYTSVLTLKAELILAVFAVLPPCIVFNGVPRVIVVPDIVPIVEVTV